VFLSMTGFGSKTIIFPLEKDQKVSLLIEIKSINSRFFEATCKLPSFLSHIEVKISGMLKEKLIRGRIYLTVRLLEEEEELLTKIAPSYRLVEEYLKSIETIRKKFKISGEISMTDIIRLPGVFISEKGQVDPSLEGAIFKNIEKVAEQLIKSREAEGKSLQADLDKSFSICSDKIEKVKSLFKDFMQEQKNAIQKLSASYQKGDEQIKMKLDELYSTLNKIDIHEEIIRFDSHLKSIKKVVKDSDLEKGKRLDFILQELMRESNTILAKCSNYNISAAAVDIKVELEKAREQAQNVV
jgi:uncharacterized protein (TIGR00255 family)